jgi:hypothetical protein
LQKRDIHIDVISSDIEMPGTMKDFGFAQWARSVRPGVDIVLAGTPERQRMLPVSCASRGRTL